MGVTYQPAPGRPSHVGVSSRSESAGPHASLPAVLAASEVPRFSVATPQPGNAATTPSAPSKKERDRDARVARLFIGGSLAGFRPASTAWLSGCRGARAG